MAPTVWDLPLLAAPTKDDLLLAADSPGGSPTTKAATVEALLAVAGALPLTPPPPTGWAWVNQGTAVVLETATYVHLEGVNDASRNVRLRLRAHTAPKKYRALIQFDVPPNNGSAYAFGGLALYESGTGKLVVLEQMVGSAPADCFEADRMHSPTSFASQIGTQVVRRMAGGIPVWLELEDDGTTITFRYSYDGRFFRSVASEGRTAWMAGGPNQVGFFLQALGSPGPHGLTVLSWQDL